MIYCIVVEDVSAVIIIVVTLAVIEGLEYFLHSIVRESFKSDFSYSL